MFSFCAEACVVHRAARNFTTFRFWQCLSFGCNVLTRQDDWWPETSGTETGLWQISACECKACHLLYPMTAAFYDIATTTVSPLSGWPILASSGNIFFTTFRLKGQTSCAAWLHSAGSVF